MAWLLHFVNIVRAIFYFEPITKISRPRKSDIVMLQWCHVSVW
jgi:hypothetical protein